MEGTGQRARGHSTVPETVSAPLVIWLVGDGKPGHENQSLGLTDALGRRVPISLQRIDLSGLKSTFGRLRSALKQAKSLPSPDLIVGAGHATHLSLIALARRIGTPCVVLMKPSLPTGLFDLCLVPRHDLTGGPLPENVIPTHGALNRVNPTDPSAKHGSLILLGGPSSTHGWDTAPMLDALGEILGSTPSQWELTDSRRTPSGVREQLRHRFPRLAVFPHEETSRDWLPGRLAAAEQVWVSEDSVSMIYESLSSGAKVGLLPVPRKKSGRVAQGVDRLVVEGFVTPFTEWQATRQLRAPVRILREADHCAEVILERWFTQAR